MVTTAGEVLVPQEDVQVVLEDVIRSRGGFRLAKDGYSRSGQAVSARWSFWAEVGAADDEKGDELRVLLEVRPANDLEARFELSAHAELPRSAERTELIREGLKGVCRNVVERAHVLLAAWKKVDVQLVRDLRSNEASVKDAAIEVLAYRANPVVAEPLLERLKDEDLLVVRRAMGGLVAMKEVRAVPLLIELGRRNDLSLMREVLFALSSIGGEEARAYLFTVAQGHDVPAIREAADKALEEMTSVQQFRKPEERK